MILDENRRASLDRWWRTRRPAALAIAVAVLSTAATVWLAYEFWRLLLQDAPPGAIDLRHRHRAVQDWFAGVPVHARASVLDPPATHVLLWPFLGWTDFTAARWIWALTSVAALAWTVRLVVVHSHAGRGAERAVAALLPLSIYATGATIGNGQLAVHLLPVLITACLPLQMPTRTWIADLLSAGLFVGALVKPNLSAPFFWILLFTAPSVRPAAVACAGYAVLTVFAASFQRPGLSTLIGASLTHASATGARPVAGNVANLHVWLGSLGLEGFALPASAAVIAALGVWVYRHRRLDVWVLLGVTAYVSLVASYHRWYDEVLILLPMVALFRIAKTSGAGATSQTAAILLALTVLSMLAPGGLFLFPRPLNFVYVAAQVLVWAAGCGLLARHASRTMPRT